MNAALLLALFLAAFSLAAWLEPWFQGWSRRHAGSANILSIALGDSRRLFAKHAYVKADAYFHGGYYPSIYDTPEQGEMHMAAQARSKQHSQTDRGFLGPPRDWIDAFSRHFYPSTHRHMGDASAAGNPNRIREEREMLPWFRLSATLDPEQPETYVVGAFWMRNSLGKINEAEQFLREGLRANPSDSELLFELGRIAFDDRHDPTRARNLWELALRNCRQKQAANSAAPNLLYAEILGHLAQLEEEQKNFAQALQYLQTLKTVSPNQEALIKWIADLKTKLEPKQNPDRP